MPAPEPPVIPWYPIKTIPRYRNGNSVYGLLSFVDLDMPVQKGHQFVSAGYYCAGRIKAWVLAGGDRFKESPGCRPTHWSPLPEPYLVPLEDALVEAHGPERAREIMAQHRANGHQV